jgi:acyl carrier protein phosphodiesterase
MLGNFVGDHVKGNRYKLFPPDVARGIILHRHIDSFTDQHLLVKEGIKLLRPGYGKYSGIVVDVFFDHFLACNWANYSPISLRHFARNAHAVFLSNFWLLPSKVKQFLPFLIGHKRLESYAFRENIKHVLDIMSRYSSLPDKSDWAILILNEEYNQFQTLFRSFFAEMIEYIERDFEIKLPTKPQYKG